MAAAPHPDISALRQSLDKNKNYETNFVLFDELSNEASQADLVIFHNLPAPGKDISLLEKQLNARNIGRWFIAGPPTDTRALNNAQGLLAVDAKTGQVNEVTPKLEGNFNLFTLDENWAQVIKTWPPAIAPFATYSELTAGDVLLSQRIGRVETGYPLLAIGEVNGTKTALFNGHGLWRWRLAEYQQSQTHEVFDGLMAAVVQYLALKEDKRPFQVSTSERVYTTSDNISFQGELYNASFQLVNSPDVNVRISEESGTDYTFLMDKQGQSYRLSAGRLPEGSYSYLATTSYNGEDYSASGSFSVEARQLEAVETTANWNLLTKLSEQQGGSSVAPTELSSLANTLLQDNVAKPILYQTVRTRPLIDWPLLLAIALALLSIDWFVRRRQGTY